MSTTPQNSKPVTIEEVLRLRTPTKGFLCPLTANDVGIKFLNFKIRDLKSGKIVFDSDSQEAVVPPENVDLDSLRKIRYTFDKELLQSKEISTTLVFQVGPQPVKNFRMIERHYFKDKLLKSFDFNFKFCIPNSTNSWESIYKLPELPKETIAEIVNSPFQVVSDSFYFINDGQMIMHNKAEYQYK